MRVMRVMRAVIRAVLIAATVYNCSRAGAN